MSQPPESLDSVDRRTSRKWVAGVLVLYGILIVMTVRVAIGDQSLQNPAKPTLAVASLPTNGVETGHASRATSRSGRP
jgi:hypothetical protein